MAELLSPVRIGDIQLRNRTVLPSMTTRLADADGFVTEALTAYYRARAEGEVGLVTVEMASPERAGRHRFRELGIYDDQFVPGLRHLVDTLHEAGAAASIQLGHAGSRARSVVSGETPVAPSAIPTPVFEIEREVVQPLAMDLERLDQAVASFVHAARRAQAAGFDMVELHAAHGYLISQFLSPMENQRDDEYGGPLHNRARFGLRVLQTIKEALPGFPVIFRIGVEDFFPGGLVADEGVQVAQWAAEAGADAVSVTAGHYRSRPAAERMIPPMAYPAATFLDFAAQVRAKVQVPVIGVGRLGDPADATAAVADGKLDLVALGRSLIADPAWAAKVRTGKPVRRCLACNHCINDMRSGNRISCVVNPGAGHELAYRDAEPTRGRRIVVLGAGPAGLSYAARVAEGNQVTVVERSERSGGAFRLTGKAPRFNDVAAAEPTFEAYISELERACRRAGVRFHFNVEAARIPEVIDAADLVVVATGARYRFGGALVPRLLNSRFTRWRMTEKAFASPRVRNLLYYRIRTGTGQRVAKDLGLGVPGRPHVVVVGDAATAGKAREAIASAYIAASQSSTAASPVANSPIPSEV
jgi:dimethylglycine catabolism A